MAPAQVAQRNLEDFKMSLILEGKKNTEAKRVPYTGRGRYPKWGLRLMPARLKAWQRAAKEQNLSVSEWLRRAGDAALRD
jgi:hypothetical protein